MTSISINKEIYNILNTDETIKNIVGNRLFPLIAEENTSFPFIIYRKDAVTPQYSKDGKSMDIVDFHITCISNEYAHTVDLCERVRELFERRRDDYFKHVEVTSITEDFSDDAYIHDIHFAAKT